MIIRLLLSGWMTNFRGVYCNGKATWLKTAPNFSSAKILGDRDVKTFSRVQKPEDKGWSWALGLWNWLVLKPAVLPFSGQAATSKLLQGGQDSGLYESVQACSAAGALGSRALAAPWCTLNTCPFGARSCDAEASAPQTEQCACEHITWA